MPRLGGMRERSFCRSQISLNRPVRHKLWIDGDCGDRGDGDARHFEIAEPRNSEVRAERPCRGAGRAAIRPNASGSETQTTRSVSGKCSRTSDRGLLAVGHHRRRAAEPADPGRSQTEGRERLGIADATGRAARALVVRLAHEGDPAVSRGRELRHHVRMAARLEKPTTCWIGSGGSPTSPRREPGRCAAASASAAYGRPTSG